MKQEKIQLTPEEELQQIIDKAKKKHGRVYKTILADEVIIWRMLKRSEFKEVMNMAVYKDEIRIDENGEKYTEQIIDEDATYDLRQEEIAKAVIIYPVGIVEQMAAVADIISTECMLKSGFGETPQTKQC
jgi:adenine specific DNA methylase Mod